VCAQKGEAAESQTGRTMISYLLVLAVTGVLYIRPTDLHPALYTIPLYELTIIPCLIASTPTLLAALGGPAITERPITISLFGLWFVGSLSALLHEGPGSAGDFSSALAKSIVYFLLVSEVVNSPGRLRGFLYCLAGYFLIGASLALLQYHGYISVATLQVMEAVQDDGLVERRLKGSGLFGDPNDVCLNLSCGIMLTLYGLGDRRLGLLRWSWLVPLLVFAYAIHLTQSRGGLLAVIGGLGALFLGRYGLRKGLLAAALAAFLVLFVVSGRQGSLSTSTGTGQQRVQMAFQAFSLFLTSPLLGIGPSGFLNQVGRVVHNSYMQILVDIGLFGAALFIGSYFHAGWTLYRMRPEVTTVIDPEVRRARQYVLAVVMAYAAGMLSLSECYVTPTYATLGIAAATMHLGRTIPPLPHTRFDSGYLTRTVLVTLVFLVAAFVYTRSAVRW
jgi:putative inorganic carbon (HCO3(-)) transporter